MANTLILPHDAIVQGASPPFFTFLFNGGLQGVLCTQVYIYHIGYPKDTIYTKLLVYIIFVVETVQTGLLVDSVLGRYSSPLKPDIFDEIFVLWLVPPLTALVTLLVECYYAFRLKIITNSLPIPVIIVTLSVIQLGGGLSAGIFGKKANYFSLLNTPENLVAGAVNTSLWNLGSTICDIIIAVCMTLYLSRFDARVRQTKAILRKIIRLTIETGTATAIVSIITFILAILPGIPTYYQVPMGIVGKIYANSLLVLLNGRLDFVYEDGEPGVQTVPIHFKTLEASGQTTDTIDGVQTTTSDIQHIAESFVDESTGVEGANTHIAPSESIISIP